MKNYTYIFAFSLLFIATSCGISEDCFKGNGSKITQTFPLDNFDKIKVYEGVGLVIKEGPYYEVKIMTSDNILANLEVKLEGDLLVVKDNSTCNIARDYGQTVVYVTAPNITEIHCKTEQDIKSDGILSYPSIALYSIDISDGAGTGDFHLNLACDNIYIESNNVSNFYLKGTCYNMHVFFSWGNGIFQGEDLTVNNLLTFYHRGTNNIILFPVNTISGDIYSVGNVILKKQPIHTPNVIEHFSGRLINNF